MSAAVRKMRRTRVDGSGLVLENVEFSSPPPAAGFAVGAPCNGWSRRKSKDGAAIDVFRKSGE